MGSLIKYSPLFGEVNRFNPFRDVDDWINNITMHPFSREMDTSPQIKMDLTENEKSYVVRAEIPGVHKEDIKISVDGNKVSIMAETKLEKEETKEEKVLWHERYLGSSFRSFTLASAIDEDQAQAKYDNGVLELTLPKKNSGTHREVVIS